MSNVSHNIANESPDAIAKRLIQKAHTRDGLPEIANGVFFLTIAGLFSLQVVFLAGSFFYKASVAALLLVIPTLILGTQLAIKKLRCSLLIEKSGYVKMKPVSRKQLYIALSLAIVAAAVAVFAASRGWFPSDGWMLAGTGIMGGVFTAFAGRIPRYVICGGLLALTGILLAFSRVSLNLGFTILYSVIGLYSLVAGIVVLLLFLRQPAESGE